METKKLPIAELQSLLDGVSTHGARHLLEAEADLIQTSYLLNEAIEKLATGFMQISGAIKAQHDELEKSIKNESISQSDAGKFTALKEKIDDEMNAVVTGLQFQDLTSQLLTRTVTRLNGLRDVLSELSGDGNSSPNEDDHVAVTELLKKINASLNHRSGVLQAGLRKVVEQKHMDCGDIELF